MAREKPLPAASLHVVFALLDGELHGYALMRRVDELSDGSVRMGPGTLYGTLNRLVEGEVRRMPDQYLWIHRRFKGLTPDYPRYYD